METIIIAERKRKYIADLIIFAILLTGVLISLISDPLLSIIFIILLIIPSVGIVKSLWNVPSKIELSKDAMVISYGRSILENAESGGSFAFPSILKLEWKNIADVDIKSYTYETFGGGDAGTITTNYEYLIITCSNIDNLSPNTNQRYTVVLNRFEKTPEEILAICKVRLS
jgi:hypothetical protein